MSAAPPSSAVRPLAGRVALVTGSTQGLGRGIVRRFVREGARVVINGRSREKGAAVLNELREIGGDAIFLSADLCDRDAATKLVQDSVARFGRLDVLVNNAQITPPLVEMVDPRTDEYLDTALESGLYASLWTARAAFPFMRDQGGGRIVNFASINGVFGSRYGTAYNAAKEAIRGLTRTLANEFGPYGVTVNVVLPAGLSPAYEAFYRDDPKRADAVARLNPMRRHGRAEEDIGAAVAGLAYDAARYITGQSLYIDGGSHLLGLPQLHSTGTSFWS
jgi:NAD(P)-dependent dehydrogenase (short-subunit alcohol dehydrogenase family)